MGLKIEMTADLKKPQVYRNLELQYFLNNVEEELMLLLTTIEGLYISFKKENSVCQ